ncbi:MAG: glycoside hydrolase family 2 protein [Anaerolineae bacterium]
MFRQPLTDAWQFRQAGSDDWLPATVPGGVHTDLLALGLIPDPFVADNELRVTWVAESDWEYRRTFTANPALLAEPNILLVCDGLDTLADVCLNDTYLGHADNMFRRWEWDVKGLLRAGENELRIVFGSPLRFIADRQAALPLIGGGDIPGGPHLRKAPCHWGWDWGPKLPPIGIWREVRLEGFSARVTDVHLRQKHADGSVTLSAEIKAQAPHDLDDEIIATLTVTSPAGEQFTAEYKLLYLWSGEPHFADLEVEINDPQLWWPNGYPAPGLPAGAAQPLYDVEVALSRGQAVLDRRSYRIGLRTVELRQEPDAWGKEFVFYVNGVRLFAKGANWIPADAFPTRVTAERLETLVKAAADANMNMLRAWGGGFYPDDAFYALCDRYGLLVWQDFMAACGIYPVDADFVENVRAEVVQNVRRLRHHPSLALWCGNNEMEEGWCAWGWDRPDDPVNQRLKAGYKRMFHELLPELLAAEDPDRPYWPSSASSDTPFQDPNGQAQGDCHYWEVWHRREPFTAYRDQFPRFMSEFGFQALPPLPTIAAFAEPADWNLSSYVMEHHQRSPVGNGLIIAQMAQNFRLPKDFPALVYLSQVLQAEGIRYGVEHWRRNRARVSGALFWQLNDCWPVASWSSIDYFGRWKALHYAARRFFAPLLLSVVDEGKAMAVHLTSDLLAPVEVLVRWRLETLGGEALRSGEQAVRVQPLADTAVDVLDFSAQVTAQNQRQVIFVAEIWQDGRRAASTVTLFVPSKHLALRDPGLTVQSRAEGDKLVVDVSAQSLARFVELSIDGVDVVWSDNYFDLPAGASAVVTCPLPAQWTPESPLQARSLFDSFV